MVSFTDALLSVLRDDNLYKLVGLDVPKRGIARRWRHRTLCRSRPAGIRAKLSVMKPCSLLIAFMLAVSASATWAKGKPAKEPRPTQAEINALVERSKHNLVFVEGGEFMMGDFGAIHSPDELPYTAQPDNKPLHKVTLDSFSISKYKVTYAEYDLYTRANGLPPIAQSDFERPYRIPEAPAGVPWQGAKNYCLWLRKLSKLPFDLPTEAQWEYAARARGQFLVFPTDDGYYREDVNVPSYETLKKRGNDGFVYPIGQYPPNPIGLYDLASNGREWMNDWFSETTYREPNRKNPTGPKSGKEKVLRGLDLGSRDTGMSMYRNKALPTNRVLNLGDGLVLTSSYVSKTFRCAVQSPTPVR